MYEKGRRNKITAVDFYCEFDFFCDLGKQELYAGIIYKEVSEEKGYKLTTVDFTFLKFSRVKNVHFKCKIQ